MAKRTGNSLLQASSIEELDKSIADAVDVLDTDAIELLGDALIASYGAENADAVTLTAENPLVQRNADADADADALIADAIARAFAIGKALAERRTRENVARNSAVRTSTALPVPGSKAFSALILSVDGTGLTADGTIGEGALRQGQRPRGPLAALIEAIAVTQAERGTLGVTFADAVARALADGFLPARSSGTFERSALRYFAEYLRDANPRSGFPIQVKK